MTTQPPLIASSILSDAIGPLGPTERRCSRCSSLFVGFAVHLCDACQDALRAEQMRESQHKLEFSKSFPVRAREDTATMTGPALDKARVLLTLIKSGKGPVIIAIGDRGTGKTVMATWLAGMLGFGLYTKAFDLFGEIRRTYADGAKTHESQIMRRYIDASFLVIDEAQERKESEWENTILTNLIDKRYDAMRPTLIIANLKEEALASCLGASTLSRARRTAGGLVHCDWPKYA